MDIGNWRGIRLPVFTKCCPCIPLRTGVLVLGYVNLVYHSFFLIFALFASFSIMIMGSMNLSAPPLEFSLLLPLLMIAHVVYNVLIIVAAHIKSVNLLKKTLIFGAVLWIYVVLYSICLFSRVVYNSSHRLLNSAERLDLGLELTVIIMEPIILGYALLLTRSLKIMLLPESHHVGYIDLDKENC